MEIWKPVRGFENFYSISNLGNVRRDKKAKGTRVGMILKPYKSTNGYLFVCLSKGNKRYVEFVHRLVARTFLGLCPKG